MTSHSPSQSPAIPRWYFQAGLLLWGLLLFLFAYYGAKDTFDIAAGGVRSGKALLRFVGYLIRLAAVAFAKGLPLGALCVLCFTPREAWRERALRVGLPALLLATLLTVCLGCVQPRGFAAPHLVALVIPETGCIIGWWVAMAWRRGRKARLLIIPKLLLVALLMAITAGVVVNRALESSAASIPMPRITSAEKRRLYSLFSGKNPMRIEEGKVVDLSLTANDINLLFAWGLPLGDTDRAARVDILKDGVKLWASTRIPRTSRHLNVEAQGSVAFADGRLTLRADRLRVGRLELPRLLLSGLVPALTRIVLENENIKPMVQAVRSIELENGTLNVRYGHGRPPKGFLSRLFHDAGDESIDLSAVRAQLLHLIQARSKIVGSNDDRFGLTVQTVLRYAREHSQPGGAALANRAAMVALGITLGHPRVESLVGSFLDDATRETLQSAFSGTTLRGRDDWPKHFFVSAALTIVAQGKFSNATGLFKEEKDAGGGSGFSFADLLADRSGTTFAEVATHDDASARTLQDRLNQGFKVDDYFPNVDGLPEGIQDAEFQQKYGGVGGERYRQLVAEIEKRVAQCPAYREFRAATPL